MATVQVKKSTADARKGKPPVGGISKAETNKVHAAQPGFTKPAPKKAAPPEKHHVASKAVKAGLKDTIPETRVVSTAAKERPALRRQSKASKELTLPKSDKRTSSAVNHGPVLIAEFVLGLVIIIITTITSSAKSTYQEAMATAMLQSTALTGVFFILFLVASGKRASQAAAWFGAIVDLGILFNAVNQGAINQFGSLVAGKGVSNVTLISQKTVPEFYSTSTDWQSAAVPGGNAPANPGSSVSISGSAAGGSAAGTGAAGNSSSNSSASNSEKWWVVSFGATHSIIQAINAAAAQKTHPTWTVSGPYSSQSAAQNSIVTVPGGSSGGSGVQLD